MSCIDKFRKNAGQKLTQMILDSQKSNSTREEDARLYYPQRDENKTANVLIRFLPQKDPNKMPFVKCNSHGFIGDDGRWCIEECPQSYGKECPICAAQRALWATGIEEMKNIYRSRKVRKAYMCNILVIKDPMNPEKEGKVFLFKFGPAIYNKIMEVVKPQYEDDEPLNPFDIFEGADFNIRIHVDPAKKMTTYEASKFKSKSALCSGDEDKIEAVLEQLYDLSEVCNETICKTKDELVQKVIGAYGKCLPGYVRELQGKPLSIPNDEPKETKQETKQIKQSKPVSVKPSESIQSNEDNLDEFRALLNSDDDDVPF